MDSSLCRHFQIEIEAAILTALRSNGISISEDDSQRFADTCTPIFFSVQVHNACDYPYYHLVCIEQKRLELAVSLFLILFVHEDYFFLNSMSTCVCAYIIMFTSVWVCISVLLHFPVILI